MGWFAIVSGIVVAFDLMIFSGECKASSGKTACVVCMCTVSLCVSVCTLCVSACLSSRGESSLAVACAASLCLGKALFLALVRAAVHVTCRHFVGRHAAASADGGRSDPGARESMHVRVLVEGRWWC